MTTVRTIDTEAELLDAIGPRPPRGRAVALVGGADGLEPERGVAVTTFFRSLAAALDEADCAVVDGGTDVGVMRLVAEAREARGGGFRLIGVAPRGKIDTVTRDGAPIRLAREHPELLLVPGSAFGDESPWIFRAADHLAGRRAATVVVDGGRLTLREALGRLALGAPVLVAAGSGRAADLLAGAAANGGRLDPAARDALLGGEPAPAEPIDIRHLHTVGLDAGPEAIAAALAAATSERGPG